MINVGLKKVEPNDKVREITDFYSEAKYLPSIQEIGRNVNHFRLSPEESEALYAFYGYKKPKKKNNHLQRVLKASEAPQIASKSISEAMTYVSNLHEGNDTDAVLFALAIHSGEVSQISFRLSEINEDFIGRLLSVENVFLSVNSFFKRERSQDSLQRFSAVFLDFDDVNDPEAFLDDLEASGRLQGIPPSIAVASGNGLHLYWLLNGCYANRLTKDFVGRVQRELLKRFPEADKQVKDFARVMRLPGSTHLKDPLNPKSVRLIALPSKPHYTIDELGQQVLPFTRSEVTAFNQNKKPKKEKGMTVVQFKKNIQSLHYQRSKDIETYLKSDNPVIHRKSALFLYRHLVYRMSGRADQAFKATLRLNEQLKEPLSYEDVMNHTNGADGAVKYNYKTQTIVDLLEISPELQKQMTTLIGKDEKRSRDLAYQNAKNESKKKETARRKVSLFKKAQTLKANGHTIGQIASQLNLSVPTVRKYLKQNLD